MITGPALAQQPVVAFAPPTPYATGDGNPPGSEPTGVTEADFDNDGDPDLAVANTVDSSFSVFINTAGTFAPAATTAVTNPSGTGPTPRPMGIASGDLNRDGNPDLAVTSPPNGGVFVFFGDGDGTFDGVFPNLQNPTFLQAGTRTFGVEISNLDADSRPDIAATNLGPRGTPDDFGRDTVSMFRNNPDGTGPDGAFGPAASYAAGDSPSSLASADLDRDGDADLAITNDRNTATSGDVTVLLGSRGGVFSPTPAGRDYAAGEFPTAIADADLDGQPGRDLVVANLGPEPAAGTTANGPDSVSVLLNRGVTDGVSCRRKEGVAKRRCQRKNETRRGNPVFETTQYPAGDGPRAVAVADFDGDGDTDFAVPYQNERTTPILSVFPNDGEGAFGPRQDFTGGSDSRGIASADFNGDGAPDLAAPDRGSAQDTLLVSLNAAP